MEHQNKQPNDTLIQPKTWQTNNEAEIYMLTHTQVPASLPLEDRKKKLNSKRNTLISSIISSTA